MREERQRLFRGRQPHFRKAIREDLRWLWAAYKLSSDQEMDQDEFEEFVVNQWLGDFQRVYIAEDVNPQFKEGKGPIGIFAATFDGWVLSPHFQAFPWATKRNRLKAIVGFIMFQRFQPDIGCIRIHVNEGNRGFFKRMEKYVPIRCAGKIAGGRADGAEHIFYVRGKRQVA